MDKTDPQPNAYPNMKQSWGLFGYIILATVVFAIVVLMLSLVMNLLGQEAKAAQLLTNPWSKLFMYILPFLVVVWPALRRKQRREPRFSAQSSSAQSRHAGDHRSGDLVHLFPRRSRH